jgi:hypothetical protein
VLVVILVDVLRVLFAVLCVLGVVHCVRHVLAAHPVVVVAMVSSPLVERGYHSSSMLDNQTHKRVSSSSLSTLLQPTNQPHHILYWALKFSLWATKRHAKVGFWPV